MRRKSIFAASVVAVALGAAGVASAQAPVAAGVTASAEPVGQGLPGLVEAPAPDPSVQLVETQRQLLAAQQDASRTQQALAAAQEELGRLRGESEALKVVREKNARLVTIGNELIASYQRRYGRGHYMPFELGRRKFEAELQTTGDRIYADRADAAPIPSPPVPAANSTTPPR